MSYCLNCGSEVSGKYCHNCGQKTNVSRINLKILLEEIGHVFTHIEHYFLYTTKAFIVIPGKTSLEYLKGKRKKYQKPVSFFIIWAGLYVLTHNFIIAQFHYNASNSFLAAQTVQEKANEYLRTHYTFVFLPILFVSSVVIYFVLAKPKLFYIETLTLCLYGAGCFSAMLIGVDLIFGALLRVNVISTPIFIFQTVISAVYNVWFCYDVFKRVQIPFLWFRLFLTSLIISLSGLAIFTYFPLIWI